MTCRAPARCGLVALRILAFELGGEEAEVRPSGEFQELGLACSPHRAAEFFQRKRPVIRRRQNAFEFFQSAIDPLEIHPCLRKCSLWATTRVPYRELPLRKR